MEVPERNRSLAARPGHEDMSVQGRERDAHVGRMGGNAMLARPEDGMGTVHALDGGTTRAGRSLVAARDPVVKVHTPGTLEQIASDGRHVPELRGRSREDGLR